MGSRETRLAGNTIPILAVRAAQFLMLSVLVLILAVLLTRQRDAGSWLLTRISISFFCLSLVSLWWFSGRFSNVFKTGLPQLQAARSSRIPNACHYLSGTFLYASFYLIMAEASWNLAIADHSIVGALLGGFTLYSLLHDFPTVPRATAWVTRYAS